MPVGVCAGQLVRMVTRSIREVALSSSEHPPQPAPGGSRRRGIPFTTTDLLLILVIFIWGSFPILGKIALREIPPSVFVPMRMWLAAGGLFVYALLTRQSVRIMRADWPRLLLVGVGGWATNQILYMTGLPLTTAGNTGLMVSTTPLFALLFAAALRQDRIGWRQVLGICISFGAVALLQQVRGGLSLGSETWRGDLLVLGSAATDGMQTVVVAPLLPKYGMRRLVTWCTLLTALALTPFAVGPARAVAWASVSWQAWGVVLWTTAFNVVLASLLWYMGIRRIGSVRTNVYQYLQPVISVGLGALLLHEPVTLPFLGVATLLLIGVVLARWPTPQRPKPAVIAA